MSSCLHAVIRSSSWKFFTHDIEEYILSLPSIQESYILGLADEDCGERVAAIIRTSWKQNNNDDNQADDHSATLVPSLAWLRASLSEYTPLAKYKLPTVLKILERGEEIPRTSNGKPSKKLARSRYFAAGYVFHGEVEVLDLNDIPQATQKVWDYEGLGAE